MLDGVPQTAQRAGDRPVDRPNPRARPRSPRPPYTWYRESKPRATTTEDTIRFVCSRLCYRSTDLVDARLAAKPAAELARRRQIADAGILREWPGHIPALFVNTEVLELWTGN